MILRNATGQCSSALQPVRAFPIGAPSEALSLVDKSGQEALWIPDLGMVSGLQRKLIDSKLSDFEFNPVIYVIHGVSTYSSPTVWRVGTDRGDTEISIMSEDDIRRIPHDRILITDRLGIFYIVERFSLLDKKSKSILDRFL